MGKLVYFKDVVTLQLEGEACTGCAMCTTVCPRGVFEISHRKARIADRDSCIECGACARNCPAGAVSVRAGVGCATAVINSMLGLKTSGCDCSIDQYEANEKTRAKGSGCC
jgi:NAD-dependent dihydropyrimidine dehydrogenase PreA subunit